MLLELRIKNFAIIERLELSFGPALNIFTGETGAGKSIVIDALSLILGDRASADLIRTGAGAAEVEALFSVEAGSEAVKVLEAAGIEVSEEIIIKRIVQRAGKNRIYINGSLATLVTLGLAGSALIDVYGQSEHQSLARPEEHIELLDTFAGLKGGGGLRESMAVAYRGFKEREAEYRSLVKGADELKKRREFLLYESKEIAEAGLTNGEEEELNGEKERLQNAGKIKSAVVEAQNALYAENGAVVERLGTLLGPLKEAAGFDSRLKESAEAVEEALFSLEDAANTLRDLSGSISEEPERLDIVLDRIDTIHRLSRKYGPGIEAVLEHKAEIDTELVELEKSVTERAGLEAALEKARAKAETVAGRVTTARIKYSAGLKKKMEEELKNLGMTGALFDVNIYEAAQKGAAEPGAKDGKTLRLGEKGADRVSFYLTPNAGEEAKPLARIASGGELSRIMLALKRVSVSEGIETLVFDEVDAGIGGATARSVGQKLKEVAKAQQVICITHLPQIAAFADKHFAVSKEESGSGRTVSLVEELDEAARIGQISKMLGGLSVTETTRRHAAELIEAATGNSVKV